jgi:hypothetical protein
MIPAPIFSAFVKTHFGFLFCKTRSTLNPIIIIIIIVIIAIIIIIIAIIIIIIIIINLSLSMK